jgi:quercetin dioxygenase-like cupin family protein
LGGVIDAPHESENATKELAMYSDYLQPVVIPPDSGKVLNFLGITHKLTHQQTGGGYYLFEFAFDPESGNSLHVHSYEDEVVYVLEGAIQIRLGNEKLQTIAGGVAHLPKRIPHALYNPLKVPSRYSAIVIPGGMEDFFDELNAALEANTLDDAMHKKISRKYGIEWLE